MIGKLVIEYFMYSDMPTMARMMIDMRNRYINSMIGVSGWVI
jgi:hypothetical protein